MNRSECIRALGDLGEQTVLRWFNYRGIQGSLSDDRFDSSKDMIVDGQTVEVKTLTPIFKYNAFCLPEQQGPKCDAVDRLIFIRMPHKPGDHLELFESLKDEDGKRDFFRESFVGKYCRFYRLTLLKNLGIIYDNKTSRLMWDLCPSQYKGNDDYRARVSASSDRVY